MDMESIRAAIAEQGLNTVRGAFSYAGGENLDKKGLAGRRRTRLTLAGQVVYLKRYAGKPRWYPWCRSPARREFENIQAARFIGIPTMEGIVCGEDRTRSFLIVTSVPGEALERCLAQFMRADSVVAQVTHRLAWLVRTLHHAGYVHRDLYSCHVFLDYSNDRPDLYLIDLARMFAPRWRKFRWLVKDLAQLKYSMPSAWVQKFWMMFLTEYLGPNSPHFSRYERAIERKVARIYRRNHYRHIE